MPQRTTHRTARRSISVVRRASESLATLSQHLANTVVPQPLHTVGNGMRRLLLALVVGAGCTDDTTQRSQTIRGERICELNELFIMGDSLGLRVYNNAGLHDCPDAWLEQIDPQQYAIGGPRWRSADRVVTLGGAEVNAVPEEIPVGLGYDMVEAATVTLMELAALEMQLGSPITTIDDLPALARDMLLETTLRSTGYAISEVSREFPTEFVHFAGQRVFVLNDGECDYAMKYYTNIFDPELVDEDAVATLGERFTLLPEGFSFSVQTFDEDLVITEDLGTQYVMVDEFGNSYDRFRCR